MILQPCRCGCTPLPLFQTEVGRGHKVYRVFRCGQCGLYGPQAPTIRGAAALWNKWLKSSLTKEDIEQGISLGLSLSFQITAAHMPKRIEK